MWKGSLRSCSRLVLSGPDCQNESSSDLEVRTAQEDSPYLFNTRCLCCVIFQFLKFEEDDEEKYYEDGGQVDGISYLKL